MTFKSPKSLFLALTAVTLVLGTATQSQAATVASNLATPDAGAGWPVLNNQWVGVSFTVGSASALWTLDSVSLQVFFSGNTANSTNTFGVSLHADDAGKPGALLASLLGAQPGASTANLTYTPPANTLLTANATYWIATRSSEPTFGTNPAWMATDSNSGLDVSAPGWSIGDNVAFSGNQGVSWSLPPFGPSMMAINASPVPEPTALLSLTLAGLGLLGRRRRAV